MNRLAASELTDHGACELARLVQRGEISAVELLAAHQERLAELNPRLGALVMPTPERARQEAEAIDAARRRGEPLGPLAGVPLSVKECFPVAGLPTTLGLRRLATEAAAADHPLVARLHSAGCVLLGKSNVPQLMLMHETDGPMFGRCVHPLDSARSPGGSGGGDAALVASGCAALALGNDLAGSLRQPAHSCGLQTLMPTEGRLTNLGVWTAFDWLRAITASPGPTARRVEDLAAALAVLDEPHGPGSMNGPGNAKLPERHPQATDTENLHPLDRWRTLDVSRLRVGYLVEDGVFHAAPAVRRAVREAAAQLAALGAHVEPFEPPPIREAFDIFFALLSSDGGQTIRELLGNEPAHPQVRRMLQVLELPSWARHALAALLSLMGESERAQLLRQTGWASPERRAQLIAEQTSYAERWLTRWQAQQLDVLLLPPYGLPALTHGSFAELPLASSSTLLANLLGWPAGVVHWSNVRRGEESDRRASSTRPERAALAVEAQSAGLPVGVQVVARPWCEAEVLATLGALETAARIGSVG